MNKKLFKHIIIISLALLLIWVPLYSKAEEANEQDAEIEARRNMPAVSDSWREWPVAPVISAESAVVMDLDSGTVIYGKNMEKRQFPASVTKLLTALIVMENCELDEQVVFSHDAVFSIERGSSNVGMDKGQSMTVEECMYCMMLASANEVANGLAEHVAGSMDAFAELMNSRASELGCTGTHFVNANGLHNEEHYTTALDMAIISRAYYENPFLRKVCGTIKYSVEATENQPDSFEILNHHRMLPGSMYGNSNKYEFATGGKTGYTIAAQTTLVTFAEKDGKRLVCVILRERGSRLHYVDTKALFDYGFDNFETKVFSEIASDGLLERIGISRNSAGTGSITYPDGMDLETLSYDVVDADGGVLVCRDGDRTISELKLNLSIPERNRFFGIAPEAEDVEEGEAPEAAADDKDRDSGPGKGISGALKIILTVLAILLVGVGAALAVFAAVARSRTSKAEEERRRQQRMEVLKRMKDNSL